MLRQMSFLLAILSRPDLSHFPALPLFWERIQKPKQDCSVIKHLGVLRAAHTSRYPLSLCAIDLHTKSATLRRHQSIVFRPIVHQFLIPAMDDSERYKLLYGPYVAPECRVGGTPPCKYRGHEVTVRGMSDGPIQWPSTQEGKRSPILCGDLILHPGCESEMVVVRTIGV